MYSAYLLDKTSRAALLWAYPPTYSKVMAHHITHQFPDTEAPPTIESAKIVGYAKDENAEAFVIAINGSTTRPDGGTYHLTYSLTELTKPVYSNVLIKKGWDKINSDVNIIVEPKLLK